MRLPAGTYDICCMNQNVRYTQATKTFAMNIGNAGKELFGIIKDCNISGDSQKIPISIMRHNARIRTKITALMDFPTDVRTNLRSYTNAAPANIVIQHYYTVVRSIRTNHNRSITSTGFRQRCIRKHQD